MSDPEQFETVLAALRAAFHAKRKDRAGLIEQLEATLAAYRTAVDIAVTRDLCKAHGLKAPPVGENPALLAEQLRKLVGSLPELRSPPTAAMAEMGPSSNETPLGVVVDSAAGSFAQKTRRAQAAQQPTTAPESPTALPALVAGLRHAPLVIVGGQPHPERLSALPAEQRRAVEWVDTTRQGTHAIGNLEQRIRDHRILCLVILEGLVQHRHSDPLVSAARSVALPHTFGGKGGKASMQQALDELESKLSQKARPAAPKK